MDYLDPVKKKQHQTRLFIGYGLLSVAVAIATVILVYIGSGYYLDRQTGDIIQNGQILIDSNPDGAQVFLDQKLQRAKTATKLVVPSGNYTVDLKKEGYRDWTNRLTLEGGRVQRLDYARLVPTTLSTKPTHAFNSAPQQVSQSIDRRFMTLVFADKPQSLVVYDLTKPDVTPASIALNPSVLTDQKKVGILYVNEWTDDGKYMLVTNVVNNIVADYIIFSRDQSEAPVNLSTKYSLKDVVFSLREHTYDKYYVYSTALKTLGTIGGSDKSVTPRLQNVVQFSGFDGDTILYVTLNNASTGKAQIRLFEGGNNYLMREVAVSESYLMAITRQGSTTVLGFGVASENKISIIKNPSSYMRANPGKTIPLATTVFLIQSPTELLFSTDSSVVIARGSSKVYSHFFEEDRTSAFDIPAAISANKLYWLDGKHLLSTSATDAYMFDFDGGNLQNLGSTVSTLGSYFDNNYKSFYTFTGAPKSFTINRTLMYVN